MTRADLTRILMNTELEGHRNLTREQARTIVNEIFVGIGESLRNGEVVRLPVGSFGVYEQDRKPTRGWFLNRVRVTYAQPNRILFQRGVDDLEPDEHRPQTQPPHKLDSKGEMKSSEKNFPHKMSPSERRKLAAIGIKAGKSRRLIAQELNVTETTIRRDLHGMKIRNQKPTATRRKPALVFKASSPAIPDKKLAWQKPIKALKPTPGKKGARRIVLPPKPIPPKPRTPKVPLSPEELRQQQLKEMVQLVQAWFGERLYDCTRKTTLLDKARIRLVARQDRPIKELSKSPMSAAELRDYTRPPAPTIPQILSRREEACAEWLANWLAAWAPKDKQLRHEVLNQIRALLTA